MMHYEIEKLAHEIYLRRELHARTHLLYGTYNPSEVADYEGSQLDDWLQAERILALMETPNA